jgi:hypothetical protein
MSYVIEKPNTLYKTAEDCPMKFSNNDISLDVAIKNIVESGKPFSFPNSDLLIGAVMDTPWSEDNA